jgi:hypothetical protein
VGFYSNVDQSFLPKSSRGSGSRVSLYVEKAYPEGHKPSADEMSVYSRELVKELQAWGWIGQVDVLDPTWIEVAYTWSWVFQGIADSIRDGLTVGAAIAGSEEYQPGRTGPLQHQGNHVCAG